MQLVRLVDDQVTGLACALRSRAVALAGEYSRAREHEQLHRGQVAMRWHGLARRDAEDHEARAGSVMKDGHGRTSGIRAHCGARGAKGVQGLHEVTATPDAQRKPSVRTTERPVRPARNAERMKAG